MNVFYIHIVFLQLIQYVVALIYSPGDQRGIDHELGGVSETYFRPSFRKVPSDIEVPEGQMARFDCIVTGRPNPDVFWFRDGTEVLEDRLHKIVINEDGISSLIFDATTRPDSGHYTCIARNRAGEDRFEVNLNVTGIYAVFSVRCSLRRKPCRSATASD